MRSITYKIGGVAVAIDRQSRPSIRSMLTVIILELAALQSIVSYGEGKGNNTVKLQMRRG